MKTFKNWVVSEGLDIFGFESRSKQNVQKADAYDGPITPIDAEILIETMMKETLHGQQPFSKYADQIQWGRNPGAVRMVISPLGSFKSIIRKMQLDLEGSEVWVCKSIVPYKDLMKANVKIDESFALELFKKIEEINRQEIESPNKEYKGMKNLVLSLANHCLNKDIKPEIFIFCGVREIKKDENYLIEFECRGHGVEAPGRGRIEKFLIDMSYNPSTGMIKSFGQDVQSPTKGHKWYPQPSEWEEHFSPNQSQKEIIQAIGAAFSTY